MKSAATLATLATAAAASDTIRGTNIGGWMVLEPWITPSLFYRFLSKSRDDVGMDTHTFCQALGPDEGNKVLRDHWATWFNEYWVKALHDREVTMVRLPIGDWTLKPYGPYVGCTDGAAEAIDWALDTLENHGIKVLLDVHAVRGSQNGFDNSGISNRTTWTDDNHFTHWETAAGEWMGQWNFDENKYDYINWDNIDFAKDTVKGLLDRWGNHPAVAALEPVNEPWWNSDIDVLKGFYRDVRNMMRESHPHLTFVFHDAFQWEPSLWNDLFDDGDIENVVWDTHQYTAWWTSHDDHNEYCRDYRSTLQKAEQVKYPVWVGEWSLATDVCATWLGGFNDANTDANRECKRVVCPYSYLTEHGVDFDRNANEHGPIGSSGKPYGRDHALIRNGMCAIDSDYFSESDVNDLGQCFIQIYEDYMEGHFMWNFRNELEPRWSYIVSYDKGWIKKNNGASAQFTQ